jgi:hypothetical protein
MSVEAITAYLEAHPDGVSERVIAKDLRRQLGHVKTSLERMHRYVYVDRWDGDDRVWALVEVPPEPPKPDRKAKA